MSNIKKIYVYANGKTSPEMLDMDVNESLQVFQYQIYSIFDILPDEQNLTLQGYGSLNNSSNLLSIDFNKFNTIKLEKHNPHNAVSVSQPIYKQTINKDDWKHTCTAVFLKDEKFPQPCYWCNGTLVCYACATTCLQSDKSLKQMDVLNFPFDCQCHNALGKCLYDQRVKNSAEKLAGAEKETFLTGINEHLGKMKTVQQQVQVTGNRETEKQMHNRIKNNASHVMIYEDPNLQKKARNLVPVEELQRKAAAEQGEFKGRDEFLRQLLIWFKNSFFTWTNSPKCVRCGSDSQAAGSAEPNQEEKKYWAGRVELHQCKNCRAVTRFPRYNHPEKLLETRTGRCGEWANCFTLICRSLGFDARHTHDWTDHVWTEVYSEEQRRWLHADSCEAALDKPKLYEAGWGKKLTYVIANSKDEVVDVTRRYIVDWNVTMTRRRDVREEWLSGLIKSMNAEIGARVPKDRLQQVTKRREGEFYELAHVIIYKPVDADELKPRESGDIAWKASRGEMGDGVIKDKQAIIKTDTTEKEQEKMLKQRYEESKKNESPELLMAKKKELEEKVGKLFQQMTLGCSASTCSNKYCKKNKEFKELSSNDAAVLALKLCIEPTTKYCI